MSYSVVPPRPASKQGGLGEGGSPAGGFPHRGSLSRMMAPLGRSGGAPNPGSDTGGWQTKGWCFGAKGETTSLAKEQAKPTTKQNWRHYSITSSHPHGG